MIIPEWRVSPAPIAYPDAVAEMEKRVALIEAGEAPELIWLLEHPPLYTAGTSAKESDLIDAHDLPVYRTGRGGQFTWHGPGQRVVYVLRDLRRRGRDVRRHVCDLEEWMIRVLGDFGVKGERRDGRIGIWVVKNNFDKQSGPVLPPLRGELVGGSVQQKPAFVLTERTPHPASPSRGEESSSSSVEEKIGAIGVRVRRWIAYHGLALNVNPDLEAFKGIVPCGLPEFGVTSLKALDINVSMAEVDAVFRRHALELSFSCAS